MSRLMVSAYKSWSEYGVAAGMDGGTNVVSQRVRLKGYFGLGDGLVEVLFASVLVLIHKII